MNSTILTVMRKELARFFGDYRMVMTTILLPGILIFVLYQFMGDAMLSQFTTDKFAPKCIRSQYTGRLVCRIEKKRFSDP